MNDLNLFAIVLIIFGILQIILFFKLWIMTNDVAAIRRKFAPQVEEAQDVEKEKSDVIENDEYDPRLDTIKPGDKVENIFDGRELIVDSIKGDKFFCKTGVFSGYKYFKKSEVKYIDKG